MLDWGKGVHYLRWGVLEIETFDLFPPEIQAYAAGVAEGVLSKLQIQVISAPASP